MSKVFDKSKEADYNAFIKEMQGRLISKLVAFEKAADEHDYDKLVAELVCSVHDSEEDIAYYFIDEEKPVLDADLGFTYKGLKYTLANCNAVTSVDQLLGNNTHADLNTKFPEGIFTDIYVIFCHTADEVAPTFIDWCYECTSLVGGDDVPDWALKRIDEHVKKEG